MGSRSESEPERSGGGEPPPHAGIAREAPDLHRLLVERMRDYAIFALDTQGRVLTWNAGAERLTGHRAVEIIGQSFAVFYPIDALTAGAPEEDLRAALEDGQLETEGWRVRKDSAHFWAEVLLTALVDDDGDLLGYAMVTRDLTDRRRAEHEIRTGEERFRLLVQSVKDYAIFMLDPTGHIATWNDGAQRIKGYTEAEIRGQHFSVFYPLDDVASGKPARELEIASQEGTYEEEGWRVRKDGSWFWASVVITRLLGADGRLAGFAKVTRDLTERRASHARALRDARRIAAEEASRAAAELRAGELRRLAEQLQTQAAELERRSVEAESANRVKGEFLAAMSHELRTPLNAIGGYVQLLQLGISGPLTDEQRLHLDRIDRSQHHLLGIINDILNYSRIEAGQVQYEVGPVSMQAVMAAVVPMVAPQAQAKELALRTVPCGPDVVARADEAKVEQILLNLLANAVKFTPPEGEIEVACGRTGGGVWLTVRDTGMGIPLGQHEAIFAPFVQVGRRLANPREGTGLGLSISRELARAMHGDLTVASREGEGSLFTLILPVV
jgi:PAS domain S-box-containing protein